MREASELSILAGEPLREQKQKSVLAVLRPRRVLRFSPPWRDPIFLSRRPESVLLVRLGVFRLRLPEIFPSTWSVLEKCRIARRVVSIVLAAPIFDFLLVIESLIVSV